MKKVVNKKFPLAMLSPTVSLADGDLLCHCHHILTHHLLRLDPALLRVQASLIANNIGKIAVELRCDRDVKAQSIKADDEKGIPDFLGSNLTYLISLGQVSKHETFPPIWKELAGGAKCQHLMMLQRALNDTARRLSVCAPIVATPGLLKITVSLGFFLGR